MTAKDTRPVNFPMLSHLPDQPGSRRQAAALYALMAIVGVCWLFTPTIANGFRRMQTDEGDTLLLNYVLEHLLRVFTGRSSSPSLWSPAFFYPEPNVLAYSENLLGTLPIYAALRLVLSPFTAFQAWMLVLAVASYAGCIAACRVAGANVVSSATAGFIYAFGLTRASQIGNPQLLAGFLIPPALVASWSFFRRPRLAALQLVLGLLFGQLSCGIYLGWFLALALGVFGIIALFLLDARKSVWTFLRSHATAITLTFLAFGLLTFALLHPYLETRRRIGERPWQEVFLFLPRTESWISAPLGSLFARWLAFSGRTGAVWEQSLFPGVVPSVLGFGAGLWVFGQRMRTDRVRFVAACLGAAIILGLLTIRMDLLAPNGGELALTAWRIVFLILPTSGAIRAVGRVWTVILPLILLAGAVATTAFMTHLAPRARAAIGVALLLITAVEQRVTLLPSIEKEPLVAEVHRVADLWRGRCSVGYLRVQSGPRFFVTQMIGMWAGLEADVPVLNGYSGNVPPRLADVTRAMTEAEMRDWLSNVHLEVCVVEPRSPTLP